MFLEAVIENNITPKAEANEVLENSASITTKNWLIFAIEIFLLMFPYSKYQVILLFFTIYWNNMIKITLLFYTTTL